MREVSIDGNILNIGGTKITVKYPIKQVESISGKYVVLLKRNLIIFCVIMKMAKCVGE